jgi:hypothetical protein
MSALILNMQVVAQLAHVLSDALRLYTRVCAKWFIEERRAPETGIPKSGVGACVCDGFYVVCFTSQIRF